MVYQMHVGVLLFAVLHRADESQPARNSCPRLPHSVDSRFGLYHVAVVLSFLRSPLALQKFECEKKARKKFSLEQHSNPSYIMVYNEPRFQGVSLINLEGGERDNGIPLGMGLLLS